MEKKSPSEISRILARVGQGDDAAAGILVPIVYQELRALAGSLFRGGRADHTLQPTALVHEAYVKLAGSAEAAWKNRAHFMAIAARAMRQILADHARRKKAAKRGGDSRKRVTLSGLDTPGADRQVDLVALNEALKKLAELSPRQSRIVELCFLGGLDQEEAAQILEVTSRTLRNDWRVAQAFLRAELSGESLQ